MIRQGHSVTTVLYDYVRYDPYFTISNFKGIKKLISINLFNVHDKYWKNRVKKEPIFSEKYDFLLVLNGECIGQYIINHLKDINPNMRSVFYTWDTTNYYRYDRLFKYFDRCYSFDLNDCKKYKKLQLLPIYYLEEASTSKNYEYDVMMVGINHDGRYSIVKRIMPFFKENNISFFIKIIQLLRSKTGLKRRIMLFLSKHQFYNPTLYKDYKEEQDYFNDEDVYGIKSQTFIEPAVYRDISAASRCILDTQRQTQSGLTARFMWALGNGKKIITTNKYALDYDFVDREAVLIIDENAPVIPLDFITNDYCSRKNSVLLQYRIDNWVRTLLNTSDIF